MISYGLPSCSNPARYSSYNSATFAWRRPTGMITEISVRDVSSIGNALRGMGGSRLLCQTRKVVGVHVAYLVHELGQRAAADRDDGRSQEQEPGARDRQRDAAPAKCRVRRETERAQ